MLTVNDIKNALSLLQSRMVDKPTSDYYKEQSDHLQRLLDAVEHGLVRK
jgi:hypothetical protein